jgi:hypothetical protein
MLTLAVVETAGLITTLVELLVVLPSAVTLTVYVPACAAVALAMVGF